MHSSGVMFFSPTQIFINVSVGGTYTCIEGMNTIHTCMPNELNVLVSSFGHKLHSIVIQITSVTDYGFHNL